MRELTAVTVSGPDRSLGRSLQPEDATTWPGADPWRTRVSGGLQTAMAPIGLLAGYRDVRETLSDAEISQFLAAALTEEILPSLRDGDPVEDAELERYAASAVENIAKSRQDLVEISRNSLSKWQARNLPVIKDAWAHGRGAQATVFAFGALAALYTGYGPDAAAARNAGFHAADDEAMLALLRSMFPGPNASPTQLERWLREIVDAEGYFAADDAPAAARFSAATAPIVHAILRDGIRAALRTMNLPPQTLPMPG